MKRIYGILKRILIIPTFCIMGTCIGIVHICLFPIVTIAKILYWLWEGDTTFNHMQKYGWRNLGDFGAHPFKCTENLLIKIIGWPVDKLDKLDELESK